MMRLIPMPITPHLFYIRPDPRKAGRQATSKRLQYRVLVKFEKAIRGRVGSAACGRRSHRRYWPSLAPWFLS